MYFVIQDNKIDNPVLWASSDTEDLILEFAQYHMDSCVYDRLGEFWIVTASDSWENRTEENFIEYCRRHEIKKRSFAERLGGKKK